MAARTARLHVRMLMAGCSLAAALMLAGCGGDDGVPAGASSVSEASDVAALVNGRPIYVSDVDLEAQAQGVVQPGKRLEVDSPEFNQVLDQLIDVKLMALEAEARQLDEDPAARHRLEAAREHILGNLLVEAVVDERVDTAAIRKMYEAQIAIWELGEEAQVRHIVAPTREEIDKVIAELNRGADFTVLAARSSSDESTRMEGGDLGFMTEDEASPEFARAIRTTATGALSRPFETEMGWHVVKIEARRKEQPPTLEELRDPILKHLTMMQIGEVLKELRAKARVERQTSPSAAPLDVDPFELDERAPARTTPSAPAAPAASTTNAPAPAPSGTPETRGGQTGAEQPAAPATTPSPEPANN